jgi:hypothetical protein
VQNNNLSPFSPNVFSPGQFSQNSHHGYSQQYQQPIPVIDFNDFASNDLIKIDGTTNAIESSGTSGEAVVLRTFDDASSSLLNRTPPQYRGAGPINLVRSRKTSEGFFESDAKCLKCLSCCQVSDYKPYFDVTTDLVI